MQQDTQNWFIKKGWTTFQTTRANWTNTNTKHFLKWHDDRNVPLKDYGLMHLANSVWGHVVSFLMNAGSEHKSLC